MPIAATLTPREVAELSGAPKRVIEKAIEEHVLAVRVRPSARAARLARRLLPSHAVAYVAIITKLDLRLTTTVKKRLADRLARLPPADIRTARIELSPAVELDVGRLVGDAMDRAERYRAARDRAIVIDEAIKSGTPVIRGTRMTVYSVLGRVEHGETIDEILADNPDLAREAIEAAVTYARTHPLMGRPAGRGPMLREAVHR
ncbi:MAG TPA: DUF433 domain-containing protein [Acetobacteraceae bacterium]|jgi:uncharacterized protein (DUF433 family)|nr:DUF433 domain-containing protein [Acetobacteraceae bacterium]